MTNKEQYALVSFVVKAAADVTDSYARHSVQSYLPLHARRELSEEEQARIEQRKRAILPKLFKTLRDTPDADMYSPITKASLLGLLGAGLGGALGLAAGRGTGAALGAGLGALGLGVLGYKGREAENANIEEMMARLPEGANRRDMQSDPVYQAEQDRNAMLRAAQIRAYAARNRYQ